MPSHLVEIGLTYLPKTGGGGALAPPGPHLWQACFSPGAKIQNGYKILSIDTYYKGKLAYPHFNRKKAYPVKQVDPTFWKQNNPNIKLQTSKLHDCHSWEKEQDWSERENRTKAYSIKHVDPTFPIQYIEFWISRQPAHSTIEQRKGKGASHLTCMYV
jgi:hypothetical protein